ncbi:DUF3226 domain-containing protein [Acinetobacter haemolyticus]|uniref:DUF3226 domain-containing protein n=1 Tax=Acinetobacter haemolyticus TaxID=29430 RepID=UPI003F55C969
MSHKIIVESFNDQAIYKHILDNFCTSSTDIESIDNSPDWVELDGLETTKLLTKLKEIQSDLLRAQKLPKIGIIIDLDSSSISDRIVFLNNICSNAFSINIDIENANEFKTYTLSEYGLDFELGYCFSGLEGQGELEHIMKAIANTSTSHYANCLEQGWKTCLETKGETVKDKDLRKLWMDFYKRMDCLTSKQRKQAKENVRWDTFLSLHSNKFDFSKDIEELNEIKSFLSKFSA